MRNGKMTYEMTNRKRDVVIGLVVPFILFWIFVVSYTIVDDLIFKFISFFPYYFYLVVVMGLFVGGGVSKNPKLVSDYISFSLIGSTFTSVVLLIVCFCFDFNDFLVVFFIHGLLSFLSLIGQLITENVYFNPGHVGYVDYGD